VTSILDESVKIMLHGTYNPCAKTSILYGEVSDVLDDSPDFVFSILLPEHEKEPRRTDKTTRKLKQAMFLYKDYLRKITHI
jgi:hypothetical protein